MNAAKAMTLKTGLLAAGAMLAMLTYGPQARATTVRIHFSGTLTTPGNASTPLSGYADLQLGTDPLSSATFPTPTRPPAAASSSGVPPSGTMSLPSGAPRVDPLHAQAITGATGMINGQAISGVQPIGAQTDPNLNEYIPSSRTNLVSADNTTGAPVVTYDNLFYADGSPLTCLWYYGTDASGHAITGAKYPFAGGFLDPYGILFVLNDGSLLDLWSNGVMPGLGLNYGATLISSANGNYAVLSSQFIGAVATVPAPSYLWLLGVALLGLFGWRRMREARRAHPAH